MVAAGGGTDASTGAGDATVTVAGTAVGAAAAGGAVVGSVTGDAGGGVAASEAFGGGVGGGVASPFFFFSFLALRFSCSSVTHL